MKYSLLLNTSLVVAATMALSISSFAAAKSKSVEVGNTSSATAELEDQPQEESPWSAGILTFLYGPPVNAPGSSWTADDSIGATTGLMTRTQASVSYKIMKDLALTPVFDFDFQITDPNDKFDGAQQFHFRDSFIKLSRSNILKDKLGDNPVFLDGDVRYYVPTSFGARLNNTIGALRVSLNPSMQIAHSRFSISITNYGKMWVQSNATDVNDGHNLSFLELYTGPQVNYLINDHINAFLLYEAKIDWNTAGITNASDPNASLADFEPGVDFRIHKRVTISPYLNWYTNQQLSTTSLNVMANFSLL